MTTLTAMLLALLLDNSPARTWYDLVHHMPVSVRVGAFAVDKPLILWINEGLMVFFFLLIALELKREVLKGSWRPPGRSPHPVSPRWAAWRCPR
jgi:NhaA family Na+:H+ antiporter